MLSSLFREEFDDHPCLFPTGSKESRRGTVVFLHGAPTQSFSYRTVMSEVLLHSNLYFFKIL